MNWPEDHLLTMIIIELRSLHREWIIILNKMIMTEWLAELYMMDQYTQIKGFLDFSLQYICKENWATINHHNIIIYIQA